MAQKEFHLPDIGEGIAEGEIVRWMVEAGQQVKEEQELVEVMTDKATVTITSPYDGVVKELRAKPGDVVPVESVIAVFEVGGAAGAAAKPAAGKPEQGQAPPTRQPQEPKAAEPPAKRPEPAPAAPRAQREESPAEDADAAEEQEAAATARRAGPQGRPAAAQRGDGGGDGHFEQASPGKVLAAPATRRRAREMGIDLHEVQGTGPAGRVTNEDLERFVGAGAPAATGATATASEARAVELRPAAPKAPPRAPVSVPAAPPGTREERVPFRGLRKKISEAMTRSKHTAAHFTYVDDMDVTDLVKLRNDAKRMYAERGVNITYLPFIMKAAVEAMRQFPVMNSSLDEQSQELVIKHYYNFGIATDTDTGLIVPVVKDVDRKSIAELARDIQAVAERTRQGKVSVDELKGGTFTLTNAGNIGGLFATPIINFPEVAILGVHAIKKTPRVRNGEIVVADVMYLSVSIDHRIVDGATGARWMNVVKENLENPQRLLLGSV